MMRQCLPVFSLLFVAALGCGGAQYAPVEGVITLDGNPLEDATVTFTPTGTTGNEIQQSYGRTDAEGRYSLELLSGEREGALIGQHKVRVAKNIETESDIMTREEAQQVQLPPNDFDFEVKAGSNEANFNIEKKKK
ncbi:MAG: hypothetical protein KDB22_29405 [Planctomycetales bacterium]|nr:hypothetical protein [Planctomycetales bacterium]